MRLARERRRRQTHTLIRVTLSPAHRLRCPAPPFIKTRFPQCFYRRATQAGERISGRGFGAAARPLTYDSDLGVIDPDVQAGLQQVIYISGAEGPFGAAINGGYDRTKEMSDGYPVYRKRCDAGMCIEHRQHLWQVKPVSNKGKPFGYACVIGGCALEDCASRIWDVAVGQDSQGQLSVKMITGAEAEQAVSGP